MLRWMVGSGRQHVVTADNHEEGKDGDSDSVSSETQDAEPAESGDLDPHLEKWTDWIKRTTGMAEEELKKTNIEDWARQQRRCYWRWAGHVARMTDERWTVKAMRWVPSGGSRRVGRPSKRWDEDLWQFCSIHEDSRRLVYMLDHAGEVREQSKQKWQKVWKKHESEFVDLICG